MRHYTQILKRIGRDDSGATAIEYGLIAALVSVAAISGMGALGNSLSNTFNNVANQMQSASSGQL